MNYYIGVDVGTSSTKAVLFDKEGNQITSSSYEYDIIVPLWAALIIVVLGLLPTANIILFAVFIIFYAINAWWDPDECENYTHVFSLRGDNIITKALLKIKNLLCKEI